MNNNSENNMGIYNRYTKALFLKSAAKVNQLPADNGIEVAFAGRSNAGKSSALNCLTNIKNLARTSKTPGRTRLMNVFQVLDEQHRLVDLPGYGYAKVSREMKNEWQKHLTDYLEVRQSLQGLILLMDCRHPLQPLDEVLIQFIRARKILLHILLTKSDKLSKSQAKSTLLQVQKQIGPSEVVSIQLFSSLKKEGIDTLIQKMDSWFNWNNLNNTENSYDSE